MLCMRKGSISGGYGGYVVYRKGSLAGDLFIHFNDLATVQCVTKHH